MATRTLYHWKQTTEKSHLSTRGRPPIGSDQFTRNRVIRFLHQVTGPCISLDSLRCLFPEIPWSVLSDLLSRYRRVWKKRYARRGYRLKWHRPGRVWAIDHSEASHPVDGQFPQILAVRDLASHCQLAWAPCSGTGAQEASSLLKELFDQFGPPLILKSDNGSAFISEVMSNLKNESGVNSLFNPPRYPPNTTVRLNGPTQPLKSTLISMRCGLVIPFAGTVRI